MVLLKNLGDDKMPRFCPFRLKKDKDGNDIFAACIGNADCPSYYHFYYDKECKYQEVCLRIEDMRERYIKSQEEKLPEDTTDDWRAWK